MTERSVLLEFKRNGCGQTQRAMAAEIVKLRLLVAEQEAKRQPPDHDAVAPV